MFNHSNTSSARLWCKCSGESAASISSRPYAHLPFQRWFVFQGLPQQGFDSINEFCQLLCRSLADGEVVAVQIGEQPLDRDGVGCGHGPQTFAEERHA